MRKIHLMNHNKRDATVVMNSVNSVPAPTLGIVGKNISFRRFVASTDAGLHDSLSVKFKEDYGQQLIDGDPEVDMEVVGRFIGSTDTVFLSGEGGVLHSPPEIIEVRFDASGEEVERKLPKDLPSNITDGIPVRSTGKKMSKLDAIRQFAFKRTVQLSHTDGLSYDFLFDMAKVLDEENVIILMGTGSGGRDPLVFQTNGTPYRAFLEGRVDGKKYQLLLHLSNMELKAPSV